MIIRYIRVRFGDESGQDSDAISAKYIKNLILDHVSASWSVDSDLFMAQFDCKTDVDDIHSVAGVATMLTGLVFSQLIKEGTEMILGSLPAVINQTFTENYV